MLSFGAGIFTNIVWHLAHDKHSITLDLSHNLVLFWWYYSCNWFVEEPASTYISPGLVWIQSFPFPRLVAITKLKIPVFPTIYGVRLRSGASCVSVFYLTPFWSCSIFTPRCFVDVTPWTRKTQKELYERRQQQIGDENILFSFCFLFFSGFNRWGNFPWIQLKWLNPPVKVFKNTLIVSSYMCVLIWYFKALTWC